MREQTARPVAGYLDLDTVACTDGASTYTAAIYVHFPFCRHICTYCNFDTFAGKEHLIEAYVDALVQQIRRSPSVIARSLYVGGGTPSLMSADQAASLLQACRDRFGLRADAEATIEANPGEVSTRQLEGLRKAGFNRLSLGVQSTDARLLRVLGRRHARHHAEAALRMAEDAGFANLSVDLIFGVPLQHSQAWVETVGDVIAWGVEHISCYMLTVEPGTPIARAVARGVLTMPPDDDVAAMYETACRLLGAAGFHRYEISNWARPGFESVHNLTYWRNQPYLGIGAGAAGCWCGRRYKIAPDIDAYIEGVKRGGVWLAEDEWIDARRDMSDSLILGLRLAEGISLSELRRRHGIDAEEAFRHVFEWAEGLSLLERDGDRLKLTERGILLSNELFARLL